MSHKVSLGIPFYGGVSGEWWTQTLQVVSVLAKQVDIIEIITCGSMTADHSRNVIVADFLKSQAEWLFWIDSDTMVPAGGLDRLLGVGKTLVSGLYYGKNPPNPPIAYYLYNGAVTPIDQERRWEKGEILPVDAVGMGCMLTHRSVFEDILKKYDIYQIPGGGLVPVHQDDILGDVETTDGPKSHEHDGKVYKGQLRQRLVKPSLANLRFPFFMIEHMRTEDIYFFDLARRVGHMAWLDTSVECGHLRQVPFTGADYRSQHGH
jgi:hypothetical protein